MISCQVVQLMNEKVAVLHGSEESRFVFKSQGIGYEVTDVALIAHALETDMVSNDTLIFVYKKVV